jgi:regulator of replication initiation timing
MKKKILLLSDDHSFPGRFAYSAIEQLLKEKEYPTFAISASYAMTSSYKPLMITGSFLPWSDANGKALSASWVSGPSTPFTPYTTPPKDDMQKLKENLDLEEQVDDLYAQLTDAKYHSATFLAGKDTAQMETSVLKDQLTTLSESLNREKSRSASDINYWKLKYDGMEGNHKYAVNHCTELNRTITLYKDEVKKLKDAKVNDEQLARQLLLKTNGLEDLNKKLEALSKEIENYRAQSCRLIDENSKLSCPGMYLPELLKCGKCVSCQLEQANRVRQELADHLAASKKETDNFKERCAQKDIVTTQLETTNKKMFNEYAAETSIHLMEKRHLRAIITILMLGLKNVINYGMFARKTEAEKTLKTVDDYRKGCFIENMQIYSGETKVVSKE